MQLSDLSKRALDVKRQYDTINQNAGRQPWDTSAFMAGFVGDVGDLSKLIMAHRGFRQIDDADQKIAHELADCLWSVIVLADQLGIDLETAFMNTMDELDARLAGEA